jgi:fructosamine-3-kinase
MADVLPNPEADWAPPRWDGVDVRAEACARVGDKYRSVVPLPGGHANLNLLLDGGMVLRIYVRDQAGIAKERRMLATQWQSFRVPKVLDVGSDFLVLESVVLRPVQDDSRHGKALGLAAAEIHATSFERAGFINADLQVVESLPATGNYFSSIANRLSGSWAALAHRTALLFAVEGVEEQPTTAVLNHGDFKAPNLFTDTKGQVVVLDWEFAFAGSRSCDQGQLFRWGTSTAFETAFAEGYQERSGVPLHPGWRRRAEVCDLFNLWSLAENAASDPLRMEHLRVRIEQTLAR